MTFLATVAGLLLLIPFPAFVTDFPNVTEMEPRSLSALGKTIEWIDIPSLGSC